MTKSAAKTEVPGTVWQVLVALGDDIVENQEIMIIESMKMEIPILAPSSGKLVQLLVKETDAVAAEQIVAWIETP